ncbi:hypothetical protein E1301_Tti021452 [Triplophysa tibetana]|uniref:Uncharacterized protein n=1 Tax=Triplophysa tibetana TaxID=1572043 RepID=A0A5A9PSF9_9TELE|nr:hypothetical protein E1301_Tti021452 [Triplophysa tibetana]
MAEDNSEEEFIDDQYMPELDDEFDAGDYSRDQERYHVEDPDTEDEVLEETPEIADARLDGNRLDLCSDLADWTVTHNQTHKSLNDLLKILREHGHSELPKDSRTLLCTPKVVECQAKCNGEYIYYGLETGIRRTLLQCPASTDHIAVTINVDGVPLFRSSAAQFWPMLAKVEGFEPFIVCLFSGMTKPVPLGDYIQDLVEEIKRLRETGIQHNGNVIQTSHNPLVQVAKRMAEKEHAQKNMKRKQTRPQPVSGKLRDSCFLLHDGSIAFVTEKNPDGKLICSVFPDHQTSNLFEKPCQSKVLNIAFIGSTRSKSATQLFQPQDLKTKAVCLPHCGGYAIFPLLHDIE